LGSLVFFISSNLLAVALGSTQPLTEMSTRGILWGKGVRCVGLTLSPSCANCPELWEPQLSGALRNCLDL